MPATIAIVHPSCDESRRLASALAGETEAIACYATVEAFLRDVDTNAHVCVIAPSDLPDAGARRLIETLHAQGSARCVVVLGRDADLATAVELVRAGAVQFLAPPLSHGRLLTVVRRVLAAHHA